MFAKYSVAIILILALMLLLISTFLYPGGSQLDKNAIGFDWTNNYLCNLFNEKAVNGSENPARTPAICGMILLCVSFTLFFIHFSKKIPKKLDAQIIQYSGVGAMISAFFLVTSYHDVMTIFASTLGLLSLFYILVYTFKSKLAFLKYLSLLSILILYLNNYIYYTQNGLAWLPILQKISFLTLFIWLIGLEYFTAKEDFIKK